MPIFGLLSAQGSISRISTSTRLLQPLEKKSVPCPRFTVSQDATQSLPSLARENCLHGLRGSAILQ